MIDRQFRYTMPTTVDEAADLLIADLTPEQKIAMAEMNETTFDDLCDKLNPYLQHDLNLWTGNERLLSSCFEDIKSQPEADPMRIIMERVRFRLLIHNDVLIGANNR